MVEEWNGLDGERRVPYNQHSDGLAYLFCSRGHFVAAAAFERDWASFSHRAASAKVCHALPFGGFSSVVTGYNKVMIPSSTRICNRVLLRHIMTWRGKERSLTEERASRNTHQEARKRRELCGSWMLWRYY